MRRAVDPRLPQREPYLAVDRAGEPLGSGGRAQGVATHPLEPIALSGRDDQARMQVQPIPPGMAGAERPRIDRLTRLTETIKAGTWVTPSHARG